MKLIPLPLALLAIASFASAGGSHVAAGAPNGRPVAGDDAFTVVQDTTLVVDTPGLLANDSDPDGDPIVSRFESDPLHGTLVALSEDGSFTYEPAPGFVGVDAFLYELRDDHSNIAALDGFVTITVIAPPEASTTAVAPTTVATIDPAGGADPLAGADPLTGAAPNDSATDPQATTTTVVQPGALAVTGPMPTSLVVSIAGLLAGAGLLVTTFGAVGRRPRTPISRRRG